MRALVLAVALASLAAAVGPASAGDLCNPVSDQTATVVPGAGPVTDRYVRPAHRDVWTESNGVPGLQLFAEWTCGEGNGQADLEWIDLNAQP